MSTHRTACPLDCPDACSLQVTVDSDRIVRIDGDKRNPLTDGFICAKVRGFAKQQYSEHRLRKPQIRTGAKGAGEFRDASWDEALDLIARKLREARDTHGGESILPICYGGSNGLLSQDASDARLFHRLGASNLARTVCAAPSGRAFAELYGRMPGVPLTAYPHAKLIVLWGVNPSATNIHLVPLVRKAQRQGATLVVIDPRRTPLAKQADLHIAPKPGTDLVIALGLIDWLFSRELHDAEGLAQHATGVESLRARAAQWPLARAAQQAGVDLSQLERLAELYAHTRPAVIRCGWGVERNRNGGSAVAAILALPAVAGHFGVLGGGFTMSNSGTIKLNGDAVGAPAPDTRTVNLSQVGRALLDATPPIAVAFSYNCNPLATLPDQARMRAGLVRDDLFTVVFDQVRTDTAAYADVLLPATTFLEHDDLTRGYGAMVANRITPVVKPHGEARPNWMVFDALCDRLELTRPQDPRGPQAMLDAIMSSSPDGEAIATPLATDGVATPPDGPEPIQMKTVWPQRPGRTIDLFPATLEAEAPDGLYRFRPAPKTDAYPLALLSPAVRHTINSTMGQLSTQRAQVELHPDDANARTIADGDRVRVFNELGEVLCIARHSDALRPGVAVLPKGLWAHQTDNGNTSNVLVSDALSDLGGGATFNDARVQVERR